MPSQSPRTTSGLPIEPLVAVFALAVAAAGCAAPTSPPEPDPLSGLIDDLFGSYIVGVEYWRLTNDPELPYEALFPMEWVELQDGGVRYTGYWHEEVLKSLYSTPPGWHNAPPSEAEQAVLYAFRNRIVLNRVCVDGELVSVGAGDGSYDSGKAGYVVPTSDAFRFTQYAGSLHYDQKDDMRLSHRADSPRVAYFD